MRVENSIYRDCTFWFSFHSWLSVWKRVQIKSGKKLSEDHPEKDWRKRKFYEIWSDTWNETLTNTLFRISYYYYAICQRVHILPISKQSLSLNKVIDIQRCSGRKIVYLQFSLKAKCSIPKFFRKSKIFYLLFLPTGVWKQNILLSREM